MRPWLSVLSLFSMFILYSHVISRGDMKKPVVGLIEFNNFVYEIFQLLAMPYLQYVLKPVIERIINEKKNVELDPVRVNSVRG